MTRGGKKRLRLLAALLVCVLTCMPLSGCFVGQLAADAIAQEIEDFKAQQTQQEYQAISQQIDSQIDESEHGTINWEEIEYYHPDIAALAREVDKIQEVADLDNPQALFDQCDKVDEMYTDAVTEYRIASVKNSIDIYDEYYEKEYSDLYDEIIDVEMQYNDIMMDLIDNGWKDILIEEWGQDEVDAIILDDILYDKAAKDLFSQEQALELEYDKICAETTVTYRGQEMTLDDLLADETMDYDTYYEMLDVYCQTLTHNLEDTFLGLVRVRTQIAETLGFDNYNDYSYLTYTRDYTPDDAKEFHETVKKEVVPVYNQYYYTTAVNASRGIMRRTFDEETIMQTLPVYFNNISPLIAESFQYMVKYHMYDIEPSDSKQDGGYTTYFESYKSPFMFSSFEDDLWSVKTIIHESGHYASYYHNPGDGPLDLAEIDSQGLEMLMMSEYENLFGRDAGSAAGYGLIEMLDSVIQGSLYDEFQQIVYEEKDLTIDEINDVFDQLLDEYGIRDIYPASKGEWALVHHNFSAPLYYISYATSAIPALEIWQIARQDFEVGKELYLSLYTRDHNDDYMEVLEQLGFSDPFEAETLRSIARDIADEMKRVENGNWKFTVN